ncbi:MAG TPA: M23 family metallopeptidase [Candidatus Limnocylindrales bacterium]
MLDATVVIRRILSRLGHDHDWRIPRADRARLDVVEELEPGIQPSVASSARLDAVTAPLEAAPARRHANGRLAAPHARRARRLALPESPSVVVDHLRSAVAHAGGAERALPIAVAILVLAASVVSVVPAAGVQPVPATAAGWATGDTFGSGGAPRLAIGGDNGPAASVEPYENAAGALVTPPQSASFDPVPAATQAAGPFGLDATLLKPVAPDTTVSDGSGLLKTYVVRQGDTLSGIASSNGLSVMTLVWSNGLTSVDLHVGQKLVLPPVNGAVIKVGDTDTLASIARDYGVSADAIVAYNKLSDPSVTIGQILVIPGGKGDPLPAATPAPQLVRAGGSASGGSSVTVRSGQSAPSQTSTYVGGRLMWPVPGGYLSQGYHYGHWAIDIAADPGTPILAAAAGTVIFAGWRSNGGGYQVWISHGSNLYTTYNHMSFVSVGAGQQVGRGQRLGGVGMTGDATGPHCHFEVWIGPVWDGGQRMNPLNYL